MQRLMLECLAFALAVAVVACGDSGNPDVVDGAVDAPSGACDAAPIVLCVEAKCAGVCVRYDQQSGFSSCTDYDACVETTLSCPPGTCSTECEAALCPDEWTCDPTATGRYGCTKP